MGLFGCFGKKEGVPSGKGTWDVKFADLVLEDEIGKGNYGKVYRGTYSGTVVAIKEIKDDDKKYLEREVKILKDVRHRNVVQLMGVCANKKDLYLVTEYLTGGHLRKKLKNKKLDIPWWLRIQVATDVAVAIQYLHSRNIIHRDLKSKNLLLDEHWRVKLCDFGLARTVEGPARRMTVCGTEEWIAPEIAMSRPYSLSADVFSFGMILWEIIYREKPNENFIQKTSSTGLDLGTARSALPEHTPNEFVDLAIRCSEFTPSNRPEMGEVAKALKQLVEQFPAPSQKIFPTEGSSAALPTPTAVLQEQDQQQQKQQQQGDDGSGVAS